MQIAGYIARQIENKKKTPVPITKVFIDVIGIGAGVVDRLRELGYGDYIIAVNSAERAYDTDNYGNKRAEMWGEMLNWMKDQPAKVPDKDSVQADMCGPEYYYDSKGRLMIEKTENIKKRGLLSPDEAAAIYLTFAEPVSIGTGTRRMADSAGISDSRVGM
jgi:hypothetical protein